jgi:hypothetical protein
MKTETKKPILTQTIVCNRKNGEYEFTATLDVYHDPECAEVGTSEAVFTLDARDLTTNRMSTVTNNNWVIENILGVIVQDENGDNDYDVEPELEVTRDDGIKLMLAVSSMFGILCYFKEAEKAMGDDRDDGEWEREYIEPKICKYDSP